MNVYVGNRLPSTYQEVEYIQSSGTQYINTGYIPNNNTKAEISMGGFDTTKQAEIFGARSAWSSNASVGRGFMFGANGPNRNYSGMFGKRYSAGGGDSFDVFNFLDGGNYILSLDQSGFYQNGVKKYTPSTVTFTAPGNLYIFALHDYALNSSGEPREFSGNKLYYFKIRDNGTLVRDFVPCYRVSDNVIGLFDKVNNKFYANAGTGTFTKGSDVGTFQPALKNAYIGEVYEYYCNFRNSSQSAMTADGWSIKTGTPTFSANGISGSSVRAFKQIPTLTSTSKIKLKCGFSLPSSGTALIYSLTEAYSTGTYKANLGGSYIDGVNQTQYIIGQTVYYVSAVSGTGTWEMNIDLGNNTVTYSNSLYNSGAIQTKTLSATEKTNILLATNIRILVDNATIKDLSILIES